MSTRRTATAVLAAALAAGVLAAPAHAAAPRVALVSRAADGSASNGVSGRPDISADGRWVVFASGASDLVPSDTNNELDVFLVDRRTGRVSNLTAGGNGASDAPRISADGRRVVFVSLADNLVQSTADPATSTHTFVWTRGGGAIKQVDLATDRGTPNAASTGADISADGKVVVFVSRATDLVAGAVTPFQHVYRRDLGSGTTIAVEGDNSSDAASPSVDADGDRVAFSSLDDVFLWRQGRAVRNLTPAPGIDGEVPSISGNGRQVAFENGDGILLVDVKSRRVRPVAAGPAGSAAISDDGKRVAFDTDADLVPADDNQVTDAYVWSATTNGITRLSGGAAAGSGSPRTSRDGALVVFVSDDLLVDGDDNQFRDVFVRRLG